MLLCFAHTFLISGRAVFGSSTGPVGSGATFLFSPRTRGVRPGAGPRAFSSSRELRVRAKCPRLLRSSVFLKITVSEAFVDICKCRVFMHVRDCGLVCARLRAPSSHLSPAFALCDKQKFQPHTMLSLSARRSSEFLLVCLLLR